MNAKYYASCPIETAGPSTYTCDTTLRNAKFSSSLQSLSTSVSERMQGIIYLLGNQLANLNVAFINTINNCTSDKFTLTSFSDANFLPISLNPSCNVILPFKLITLQFTLSSINTVGGLRVGLNAPGNKESITVTLHGLAFSYVFNKMGCMLGSDTSVVLQLTLLITETSYYILNEQSPIARLPEIIYHDFIFITMIIGMFVLIFVIVEVLFLPCIAFLIHTCRSDYSLSNLPNSTSYFGGKEPTEHKRSNAIVNRANYDGNDRQRLPPIWNRQAYL